MAIERSGAAVLVEGLERWGMDTFFGLPGVHLDSLFDALYGVQDRMRIIHSRHEQGAAYMAFGSAMATGKPSAFAVVPGPGFLNATAAMSTAYACNAPVLCIIGTVVKPLLDRGYGALHELPDQSGMVQRLTKWSARVEKASDMTAMVDEAFYHMLSGRPRPVALEIAPEVFAERGMWPDYGFKPEITAGPIDPAELARAVELVRGARSPMIVVGGGAQHAGAEVRALAERIGAPVVSRQMGRGILPDDHPLSIRAGAANALWAKADVVIGIGTRLGQLREWGHDDALKVIRIDADPDELYRVAVPAVGLVTDSAVGAAALVEALNGYNGAPADPLPIAEAETEFDAAIERDVPLQKAYMDVIREMLPADGVLVDEITQVGHAAKLTSNFQRPRSLITSGYQGTLGYGYATALGAQAGAKDRVVISINGDGGLLYTIGEMATAVQHGIPLVAIVFNDNCFGNVQVIQKRWYGDRVIATDLHNPDFVKLADSFGLLALRTDSPYGLREALRTAIDSRRPTLIEVPIAKEAMGWVWDLIIPKKVRGPGAGASAH
ncbi:MAG: thiamine pyrophosphate-dependent enzyme [Croceibacterium sp.]